MNDIYTDYNIYYMVHMTDIVLKRYKKYIFFQWCIE